MIKGGKRGHTTDQERGVGKGGVSVGTRYIVIDLLVTIFQDTKVQLEKANFKIKEAKEETQQIRQDCQAMIKTYQVSRV